MLFTFNIYIIKLEKGVVIYKYDDEYHIEAVINDSLNPTNVYMVEDEVFPPITSNIMGIDRVQKYIN